MTGCVRHSKDERGVALPAPVIALSVFAVVAAVIVFWLTGGDDKGGEKEITPAGGTPSATASTAPKKAEKKPVEKKPAKTAPKPVERSKVNVEIYNNTRIAGLAGEVAGKATTVGWNVVGEDNWVGAIPESTVYYPPVMKREGEQLAADLGIKRTHVAVEGSMKGDRLTVVLTGAL
ncbi:LytR cell envelope-related transcriptional attenuator [Nocardioides albertanoniae]|uniref:LytR cell envelope-related transcriptional attenuator n=1 Tax=Nocardioides albertanoniae TaxID=1175486 RepID=A0A543A383_9ACTN|nr:LytR C-terminal domain-containing protein [Nocardioides albertanoniae]TQL67040.1 LytR cell envelope-related transcriptional attenuator [Nocardioides albertanoniae]